MVVLCDILPFLGRFWEKMLHLFMGIFVEIILNPQYSPLLCRAEQSCSNKENVCSNPAEPCCLQFVTEQLAVVGCSSVVCLISQESEKFYGMFGGCSVAALCQASPHHNSWQESGETVQHSDSLPASQLDVRINYLGRQVDVIIPFPGSGLTQPADKI